MRKFAIPKNPFLLFLPFLVFFIVLALILPTHGNASDENRYLMFAQNLLHGFYSPPAPGVDLGTGPGYPFIIFSLVALSLPLVCITVLNAILYYLSIVLLFKALEQILSFKTALGFSLFWAFYYNSYENIPMILTETFASFLTCFLIFTLVKAFNSNSQGKRKIYIFLSGLTIAYIVLTKVIFGYVLLVMFIASILLWAINRRSGNYRKGLIILSIAFITTVPYLIYTYHLTGKIFYWSTFGGNNLYWMSSPYDEENGSWIKYPMNSQTKDNYIQGGDSLIDLYHRQDFVEASKYKGVEQDEALKRIAIENIKSHPGKFIQNCACNIGRLLFNYPYSYTVQKPITLLRFPMTGIIAVLMLFCTIPTFKNWRKLPYPIRFLLFFVFLYLGGSVFGSAETRMFTIAVPALLFWIAFIITQTIKVNLNFKNETVQ
jgi:4-amino-4-deoxy-L-arabinose transferase-like glycosyltransferase